MNNNETQLEKAYGMLKLFMEGQTKEHHEIIDRSIKILELLSINEPDNLNYLVDKKEESNKVKTKRMSQIDKFNKKYNP